MLMAHHIAHWYQKRLHDKGDKLGQSIMAQGEEVEWCMAAAMQCCREAGCWLESSLPDRYKLRSVETMVGHATRRGLFTSLFGKAQAEMARGVYGGLLATFARDGRGYGHVGVVDLDSLANAGNGTLVVVEFNTADDAEVKVRRIQQITGYILVPRGGPLDN